MRGVCVCVSVAVRGAGPERPVRGHEQARGGPREGTALGRQWLRRASFSLFPGHLSSPDKGRGACGPTTRGWHGRQAGSDGVCVAGASALGGLLAPAARGRRTTRGGGGWRAARVGPTRVEPPHAHASRIAGAPPLPEVSGARRRGGHTPGGGVGGSAPPTARLCVRQGPHCGRSQTHRRPSQPPRPEGRGGGAALAGHSYRQAPPPGRIRVLRGPLGGGPTSTPHRAAPCRRLSPGDGGRGCRAGDLCRPGTVGREQREGGR